MEQAIATGIAGKVRPLQVAYWGLTTAYDLTCPTCKTASGQHCDEPELSLDECRGVIDQLPALGRPVLAFTGSDPLRHEHLFDLIRYARSRGLRVGVTPAVTPQLTYEAMDQLRRLGVSVVVIDLDGADAATHDAGRRAPGSFSRTLIVIECLRSLGVTTWVNTAILPQNWTRLEPLAQLLVEFDIQAWNLLGAVPASRGALVPQLVAQQYEVLFHQIYELSTFLPFRIQVSYAPQYRRVIYQRLAREGELGSPRARMLLSPPPMAANGSLYITHAGNVWPSGVMPVSAGNVREQRLADIYAASPLFQELRDTSRLRGRCGDCDFVDICGGGCRARAYAMTGDYLASDPLCVGRHGVPGRNGKQG